MRRHLFIYLLSAALIALPLMGRSQTTTQVVLNSDDGTVWVLSTAASTGFMAVIPYPNEEAAKADGYTVQFMAETTYNADCTVTVALTDITTSAVTQKQFPNAKEAATAGYKVPVDAQPACTQTSLSAQTNTGTQTGTSATASSEPASGCGRISLGGIGGGTEETVDQGQTLQQQQTYDPSLGYDPSQTAAQGTQGGEAGQGATTEGQTTEEWSCNDALNEDGTLTCFKPSAPDVPVICTVEGENVFCPE